MHNLYYKTQKLFGMLWIPSKLLRELRESILKVLAHTLTCFSTQENFSLVLI